MKNRQLYKKHLKNEVEHMWVETYKCLICGKYHEAYLYEMNPKPYQSLQKMLNKLLPTPKRKVKGK